MAADQHQILTQFSYSRRKFAGFVRYSIRDFDNNRTTGDLT